MLERKFENCYIKRAQPIKQKKQNGIKKPTPVEVCTS